jgi:hypothetical protein
MLHKLKKQRSKIALIVVGLISLTWFLIRVIPKPSRAAYPCQRAAFPAASTFVIWIFGVIGGKYFFKRAKYGFSGVNYILAIIFLAASVLSFSLISLPFSAISAAFKKRQCVRFCTNR